MDRVFRLDLIRDILEKKEISSQEELIKELSDEGVTVTQATLSRDLKTLRVARVTSNLGRTRYVLQDPSLPPIPAPELPDHLSGVSTIEFSGQLGVIKTLPGFANAVAYHIDQHHLQELMGTIAGDDTILLLIRSGISANEMAGAMTRVFPKLKDKFI